MKNLTSPTIVYELNLMERDRQQQLFDPCDIDLDCGDCYISDKDRFDLLNEIKTLLSEIRTSECLLEINKHSECAKRLVQELSNTMQGQREKRQIHKFYPLINDVVRIRRHTLKMIEEDLKTAKARTDYRIQSDRLEQIEHMSIFEFTVFLVTQLLKELYRKTTSKT